MFSVSSGGQLASHRLGAQRLVVAAVAVMLFCAIDGTQADARPAAKRGSNAGTGRQQARVVDALHRSWVFGWNRKEGSGTFSFKRTFEKYYDWTSDDVRLYDDFDPQHRVAHSAAEYGTFWEPGFNALKSAEHRIYEEPSAIVSGRLAASRLVFLARLVTADNTVIGTRTTSSLVFRRSNGDWRIVREHNSSVMLTAEQIDAAMAQPAV